MKLTQLRRSKPALAFATLLYAVSSLHPALAETPADETECLIEIETPWDSIKLICGADL